VRAKELLEMPISQKEIDEYVSMKAKEHIRRERIREWLSGMFKKVEERDETVKVVVMQAEDYAEVRKYLRDEMECETQLSMMKTGQMATMWHARFFVDRLAEEPEIHGPCPDGCMRVMVERGEP